MIELFGAYWDGGVLLLALAAIALVLSRVGSRDSVRPECEKPAEPYGPHPMRAWERRP